MVEYIEKENLIKYIDSAVLWSAVTDRFQVLAEIKAFEKADVAPVKHGKWIHNDDWWEFICTVCHKGIGDVQRYNYCPRCGAKMSFESE